MDRRSFLSLLAASSVAGCSISAEPDGEASISPPSGDWTQFRGGPRRRGYTTRRYTIDGDAEIEPTEYRSLTAPVLDGDTAIVPSGESLVGLDLQDFSTAYELPWDRIPAVPLARCSSVVAVPTATEIVAYDLQSESQAWTLAGGSTFSASASPAALGSHFVVQDGNRLRLVEHETGTVVWSDRFDARVDGFAASTDALVVNRNTGEESEFVALDPGSGERRWSVTVESSRYHPVVGEFVFGLSEFGRLVAIDDGDVQWRVETDVARPESMAVTDEFVLVGPGVDGEYAAVAIEERSVAWRLETEFGNPAVVNDQRAFVPDANEGLVELELSTGSRLRTHSGARSVDSLVPTARGLVYTHTADDQVNVIRGA